MFQYGSWSCQTCICYWNKRVYQFPETQLSGPLENSNNVLKKGKSIIPPLFNGPNVSSSASNKAKLFPKSFSKNFNLDDSVSLYLFSLLELIWNCRTFLIKNPNQKINKKNYNTLILNQKSTLNNLFSAPWQNVI